MMREMIVILMGLLIVIIIMMVAAEISTAKIRRKGRGNDEHRHTCPREDH